MAANSESLARALPRGPHGLTRAEVESSQRARLLWAISEAVAEKGYTATTVTDIISRAKVSRTTFYQLFDDKLDCFLAANSASSEFLMLQLTAEFHRIDQLRDISIQERFIMLLTSYLDSLTELAEFAKVFLVEIYAAGAPAVAQRRDFLRKFVDFVASSGWGVEENLLTPIELRAVAEVIVSTLSLNATTALAVGDVEAIDEVKNVATLAIGLLLRDEPVS